MPYPSSTPIITADTFRADLPEFLDKAIYLDSWINYWLAVATIMLNACRWGNALQLGTEQFVAHHIVLEAQQVQTGQAGGWPGISKGAISSETPGEVSVSYDTVPTLEEGAGHWNLTVYGSRFIRLARLMGAGPLQIGPGGMCAGGIPGTGGGAAWSGPNCLPGWFGS